MKKLRAEKNSTDVSLMLLGLRGVGFKFLGL